MSREAPKDKNPAQRRQDQREVRVQATDSLRELERLIENIKTGVSALRQKNSEKMLGISPQIDMIDGPTQRMNVIIEGLLRSVGS